MTTGSHDLSISTELVGPGGCATSTAGATLIVAGAGQLATYELGDRELVIGRSPECEITVEHRALSRRHAVVRGGATATVQDLGSTNGTHVAGRVHIGGDPIPLATEGFHIGPFAFVIVPRVGGARESGGGGDLLAVADPTPAGVPALVAEIARSQVNVLILGETGVGKEVLASTVHELSGRAGTLTRINCAALTESLLESELFGHEKGAFTGAVALKVGLLEASSGGTVMLDEIGELPLGLQAKLLRAVEQREITRLGATRPIAIDVRFVAATNRDLPAEIAAGRFRRDLYFRLDGITLGIPPLRERRGAIGMLALRFFGEARVDPDVIAALEAHPWPGNVRELKAVVERATLLARGGEIRVRHLAFAPTGPAPVAPPPAAATAAALTGEAAADRDRIVRALDECAGNQTRAAKRLGMSRTAFVTKMRVYRIPRPRA